MLEMVVRGDGGGGVDITVISITFIFASVKNEKLDSSLELENRPLMKMFLVFLACTCVIFLMMLGHVLRKLSSKLYLNIFIFTSLWIRSRQKIDVHEGL